MFLTLAHHVYDLQPLGHKVGFDGESKVIFAHPGVTSLSIKADVYSAWKEWAMLRQHTKFLFAMRSIGGDPTVAGQRAGDIYFMINGWKLIVDLRKVRVTGTLYSADYPSPYFGEDMQQVYAVAESSIVNTLEMPLPVITGDMADVPTAAEIADAVAAHRRTLTVQKYLGFT